MALSDFESTMEWKVDITSFTKGMQEARAVLKTTNSEFKLTSSTMERWSDNITGLEAKIRQLGGQMEAEARMVKLYEVAWEEAKKQFGETSPEAERLAELIEKHTINFNKAETQLGKYNTSLTTLEQEQKQLSTATSQLNQDIENQERLVNILKNAYKESLLGDNPEETERFAAELLEASTKLNEMKSRMDDAEAAAERLAKGISTVTEDQVQSISKHQQLTNAIEEQQKQVDALKDEYASAVLQYGKTSTQAQELGKQLKVVSNELADNKKKMAEVDDAADKLDRSLDEVEDSATEAANGGFTVLKGALANLLTQGINKVIDGFKTLSKNAVTYQNSLEGYQTSFEVMTGSADKAAETVERLGQIAIETPFDMPTLAESTQLLMNFGLTADEAINSMMMLGDISQGSSDKMLRIALAYGQMSSAGKVHLQDIKQMIEAGFNPLQEISEHTGESMESLYKRISKGTISVDEIKAAFVRATSAGGKYYQSMDKQSQTLTGRMSALQETVNATLGKTMTPLLQRLADTILPRVTELIEGIDTTKLARGFAEFADKAVEGFEWIVEHGGDVLDIIQAISVAFVTYKAASIIGGITTSFVTLFKTIDAGKGVMAGLNAAFGATPAGLVALAVAGLAGAVAIYTKRSKEAIQEQYGLNKEQQEAITAASNLAYEYQELVRTREMSIQSTNSEFDNLERLKNEYNSYIDSNGKIKKGYEDRANFILTTLAQAFGMEVDELKKLIEKNGELGESIDKLIEKKKAEAMLSAYEESYSNAIRKRGEALDTVVAASKALEEADKKRQETQEAANKVWERYNELAKESPESARAYLNANSEVIQGNGEAQKSYEEASAEVEKAQAAWIGYNDTIQKYEGLSAAIISGDSEKIKEALRNLENGFITAESGNRESLERQVEDYKTKLAEIERLIKEETPYITEEERKQMEALVEAAEKELAKLPPKAEENGEETGEAHAEGVESTTGDNKAAGEKVADATDKGAKTGKAELEKTGEKSGEAHAEGVESTEGINKEAGEGIAEKAVEGSESENGEGGGAQTSGSNFGEGFWSGIGSWFQSVWERGKELAKKALAGLKEGQEEGSPSKITTQSGVFFGKGYALGIESMIDPVVRAASDLASEAVNALGHNMNQQMLDIGKESGHSLIDGMDSVIPQVSSSIANLKNNVASAKVGMNIDKLSGVGSFGGADNEGSQTVVFNQTINSPKAVDRLTLYRQTNSLLFNAKVRLNNV